MPLLPGTMDRILAFFENEYRTSIMSRVPERESQEDMRLYALPLAINVPRMEKNTPSTMLFVVDFLRRFSCALMDFFVRISKLRMGKMKDITGCQKNTRMGNSGNASPANVPNPGDVDSM